VRWRVSAWSLEPGAWSWEPGAGSWEPSCTRTYAVKFSTRRRLCRVIFCLACMLPTLLVGTAIVVLNAPAYRAAQTRAWQTRLSGQLGLEVQVAEVMPRGGSRWLARGLECRDPESHEWLARARSADMAKTTRGWLVTLGQPQLNARRLGRLVTLLHEHILLRANELAAPVQLAASSVELSDESNSESVLDVRSAMDGSPEGAELLLEFRSPSVAADERVRVRLVRNRQLDPPATGWELHTDSTGLPCSVALSWLPALSQLGDACVFQGSVWCEQHPAGWEVELRGVFRQVDLEKLVTRQFPHKLSGSAVLTVNRCKVHAGRVTEIQGRLSCEGGVVSQSLLDAAERSLGLQQHPRAGGAELLRYQQLALDFSLSAAGLVLAAPGAPDTTLLADSHGPLLSLRDSAPRSPLSLVHLLVPQADMQVPATRETAAIVRTLPLPELSVAPAAAQRDNYSPLRFHRR
jgi:hypothetical protein